MVACRGPTVAVPEVASLPDQPPLAVQPVALELLQVNVADAPGAIVVGFAVRLTCIVG